MIPLPTLVRRVVEDTGIDLATVNIVVRSFLHHIRQSLAVSGGVRLDGLGRIQVLKCAPAGDVTLTQIKKKRAGYQKVLISPARQLRVFFKKAPTFSALLRREHGD